MTAMIGIGTLMNAHPVEDSIQILSQLTLLSNVGRDFAWIGAVFTYAVAGSSCSPNTASFAHQIMGNVGQIHRILP